MFLSLSCFALYLETRYFGAIKQKLWTITISKNLWRIYKTYIYIYMAVLRKWLYSTTWQHHCNYIIYLQLNITQNYTWHVAILELNGKIKLSSFSIGICQMEDYSYTSEHNTIHYSAILKSEDNKWCNAITLRYYTTAIMPHLCVCV